MLSVSAPASALTTAQRTAATIAPATNTASAARTRIAAQRRVRPSSCSTGSPVKSSCSDDEHWQARAIAAVRHTRESDPEEWARYLRAADALAGADAPLTDEWIAA